MYVCIYIYNIHNYGYTYTVYGTIWTTQNCSEAAHWNLKQSLLVPPRNNDFGALGNGFPSRSPEEWKSGEPPRNPTGGWFTDHVSVDMYRYVWYISYKPYIYICIDISTINHSCWITNQLIYVGELWGTTYWEWLIHTTEGKAPVLSDWKVVWSGRNPQNIHVCGLKGGRLGPVTTCDNWSHWGDTWWYCIPRDRWSFHNQKCDLTKPKWGLNRKNMWPDPQSIQDLSYFRMVDNWYLISIDIWCLYVPRFWGLFGEYWILISRTHGLLYSL